MPFENGIRRLGQFHQMRLIAGLEHGIHRLRYLLGTRSFGDLGAPCGGLFVQVIQVAEDSGWPEIVADKTNGSFDAAFLISSGDRDRAWLEAVMAGKFQQGGIETNR